MDSDFIKTPKVKQLHKWRQGKKRKMFWSPFGNNGNNGKKAKRSGSRYYSRQIRKVKLDMGL